MFLLRLLCAGVATVYTFISSFASNALIPVQSFGLASTVPAIFFAIILELGIQSIPRAHVQPVLASFFNSISAVPISSHSLLARSPVLVPSVIVPSSTALSVQTTSFKFKSPVISVKRSVAITLAASSPASASGSSSTRSIRRHRRTVASIDREVIVLWILGFVYCLSMRYLFKAYCKWAAKQHVEGHKLMFARLKVYTSPGYQWRESDILVRVVSTDGSPEQLVPMVSGPDLMRWTSC